MPRTSRSVAQRLATQTKSKRRRPTARPDAPAPEATAAPSTTPAPAAPASSGPSVDQILDEVVPSAAGPRAAATPTIAPAAARRGASGRTARPAPVRRRYSEYAEEYRYIWADLRRIAVVAGVLVALLIALSFFIQ